MWNPSSNSCFVSMWKSRNRSSFITVVMLGFIILCFLLSYNVFGLSHPKRDNLSSLVNVQIVFRHGEKNPTSFYSTDPFKKPELWPDGFGQLTNRGKVQLYNVGKNIRDIYSGWLPDHYSTSNLKVRSSYADRCQMSVQVLLAGLYPPKGSQVWNEELLWQPIPINSVPRQDDNVIVIGKQCKKYAALRKSIEADMNEKLQEENTPLLEYLAEHTGESMTTVSRIEDLYFNLFIEKENGYELPSWVDDVFPSKLEPIAKLMEASLSWTEEAKSFASGRLLSVMIDSMQETKKGKGVKLSLYSAHDVTLVSLSRVLSGAGQTPPSKLPAYGSAVVIELHEISHNYYVRMLYYVDGMTSGNEASSLKIPGCSDMCPWDQFLKFVQKYSKINWDIDCENAL